MPLRNEYRYYETGSAARKVEYPINKPNVNRKRNNNQKNKKEINAKTRLSSVAIVVSVFVMALILVYRYNVINEKNLKSQSLSDEFSKAEASLVTAQIEVEKNTDLNEVESYAKQKLGMQKPSKNQTIYVDTSKTSNSIEIQNDKSSLKKISDNFLNFVKSFFK